VSGLWARCEGTDVWEHGQSSDESWIATDGISTKLKQISTLWRRANRNEQLKSKAAGRRQSEWSFYKTN